MPLNTYIANRGFIGMAPETVIGTPVAATKYIQLLDENLAAEPGVITQKLMRQSRQVSFQPVLGEQQVMGKIDTPLYVDQGLMLLAALIGTDTYQSSTAAGAAVGIGASGVAALGASSITSTVQTSTPIATNDYIQIQQVTGTIADANLAEIHKVSAVSGAGPYVFTIGTETLARAYTTLSFIARIPAATTVFTHTLHPDQPTANTYKTLTLEKNRGLDSRQYAGATLSKGSLKVTTKDMIKMSYDVIALTDVAVTATTSSFESTSSPLSLTNVAVSAFGSADTSFGSFDLDINQGAKPEWTFNTQNMPAVIPPMERTLSGKWTNIVQSDVYRANALAGTFGALVLTLTQGLMSIAFTLPKVHISKIGYPLKVGSLIYYDVSFMGDYDDTTGRDISVAIVTSTYLPIF